MFIKSLLVALLFSIISPAFSSIVISGTRIIFPGDQNEVNVRTTNKSATAALAQVWIDAGDIKANLQNTQVPFIATPPVYRVEPNKGQSIRLIYNGMALPQDRESLFWFNLLEIPPKKAGEAKGQRLEIAFRTRIKLFYRPKALLNGSATTEVDRLEWQVVNDSQRGRGIKIKNPTPYYYSFNSITVYSGNKKVDMKSEMAAPKSEEIFFPENKAKISSITAIDFEYINDYGGVVPVKLKLSGDKFIKAQK